MNSEFGITIYLVEAELVTVTSNHVCGSVAELWYIDRLVFPKGVIKLNNLTTP